MPVQEQRFVVFDTETTGLNPKTDRLLSIGAVAVQFGQINLDEHLDLYLYPQRPATQQEVAIHGILPVEKPGMVQEEEALERFIQFIGNAVLVGHYVSFDLRMIHQALKRLGLPALRNKSVDTQRLARRLAPPPDGISPPPAFSLDQLCVDYGVSPADRHTAAGDAYLTALLFMKMMNRLQARGVKSVGGILR